MRYKKYLKDKEGCLLNNLKSTNVYIIRKDKQGFAKFEGTNKFFKFYNYAKTVDVKSWNFHEVYVSEIHKVRKLAFDIDVENGSVQLLNNVTDDLIQHLLDVLKNYGIDLPLENIMYFSSNKVKGKKSVHLIVTGYLFACTEEKNVTKFITKKVKELMNENLASYVDDKINNTIANLRIYMGTKIDEYRPKIFQQGWYYKNQRVLYNDEGIEEALETDDENISQFMFYVNILMKSSITDKTYCEFVDIKIHIRTKIINEEPVDYDIDEVMNLLENELPNVKVKVKQYDENGYIQLENINGYKCPNCNRTHEKENPYLLVKGKQQYVFFGCRRNYETMQLGILRKKLTYKSVFRLLD